MTQSFRPKVLDGAKVAGLPVKSLRSFPAFLSTEASMSYHRQSNYSHAAKGSVVRATALVAFLFGLAGCGGGGGGDKASGTDSQATVATSPDLPASLASEVAPSCSDCAALDSRTYSGSGIGIWHARNIGTTVADVTIAISGLNNNDVTLIFTNETASEVAMPGISLSTSSIFAGASSSIAQIGEPAAKVKIDEFNRTGWTELLGKALAGTSSSAITAASPSPSAVGSTRVFNHHDGSGRNTTLKKAVTLSDGVVANIWVETTEAADGKVSTAHVDQLASSFAGAGGVYDMLKNIGGPLWGPHTYPELLSGSGRPVDIVVLNFDKNGVPYGEVGYFYSIHNFYKTYHPESNESISLYLDAETLYLDGTAGMRIITSTLAHEGMHMSNFYRRGVSMGPTYQYDTWLEEMTALMLEDSVASRIDPSYSIIRDVRFPQYHKFGSYNCSLLTFVGVGAPCDSYAVNGSFGGFLLRQMGMPFFRNVLSQATTDSKGALENAIKTYRSGSDVGTELRKFAVASIAALPAGSAPLGFALPARLEGGYSIPVIDAEAYKSLRSLPTSVPPTLKGLANFPVLRKGISGTFEEVVRVPPGTSLSVVIN